MGWILIGGTLLLSFLAWWLGRRRSPDEAGHLGADLFRAAVPPFLGALLYYGSFFAAPYLFHFFQAEAAGEWFDAHEGRFWHLGVVGGLTWFLYRAVRAVDGFLSRRAARTPGTFDDYLFRLGAKALRTLIPVFGLLGAVSLFPFGKSLGALLFSLWLALLTLAVARILLVAVSDGERTILARLDFSGEGAYAARGLQTRVRILRKFAAIFVGVVTVALLLLLIPGVETLGKSLLASAGVAGIVLSFAAQQSLGTLFAGLQLALTQPIRLGDKVFAQGEMGTVEEITSTYVVMRTWDRRGLVVPITMFITQPFQNLSRNAVSTISVVKIRADFSLPVPALRETVKGWLEETPLWDRKTYALQVTDSDAGSMEVRVLASAVPDSAFDLQCLVRERLLAYLHQSHESSLPGVRYRTPAPPAPTPPQT